MPMRYYRSVSYTHLDVYKRQEIIDRLPRNFFWHCPVNRVIRDQFLSSHPAKEGREEAPLIIDRYRVVSFSAFAFVMSLIPTQVIRCV